jgi:formate hydrogenlyase subunit 4
MIMDIVYVFVNVAVFLLFAPLFQGVTRKITAKIQSRQGPPLLQPYFDLIKLLGKERMNSARNWAFSLAPLGAFAAVLTVAAMIPLGGKANFLTQRTDIISLIYMLVLGGVCVLLGALASRNTFALIGASREMATMIMIEPVLAMTLILGAVKSGGLKLSAAMAPLGSAGYGISAVLMLVVYLLALQAFVGRQPFDIAEAEVEILEGPFIEYSGAFYGLFKYAIMMKQMFYAFLFVSVFVPLPATGFGPADILIQLLGILVVFVLIAVIGATNPRFRIDQAVKFYAGLIAVALVAAGLAVKGF